jgi:hypothetical protein
MNTLSELVLLLLLVIAFSGPVLMGLYQRIFGHAEKEEENS